jgi:hypothetical protein
MIYVGLLNAPASGMQKAMKTRVKSSHKGNRPDCDEYQIVRKRVSAIRPSPENEQLYPSIADDPGIDTLAESIRKIGLREPLVLTADGWLVSGHRRLAALKRVGQVVAPCRVLLERRDSMTTDAYLVFLREHNRNRHKSVAEQVREEMVDIDPERAHRRLREQRDRSIFALEDNGVEPLMIEGIKTRHSISDQKAEHVQYVRKVVFGDRADYWPLSIRGVHYALLNYDFLRNIPRELPYKNDDESYQATSDLITRMRLTGSIPWKAFDDATRPLKEFRAFHDVRHFVRLEVENLFGGYWRDLLQTQPNHVEVLCEKNTIYHMVLRVTEKYQIATSSGRGFNSIDPWHDLFERYRHSGKERLIVIVLSDFDPEGEMIPQVGGRTLRDDFGVEHFSIIKAGVTARQIGIYGLPPQNFAKETSSNYDWFIARSPFGENVYELEALEPERMMDDLEDVIQSVIDIDLFNREVEVEQEEAVYLEAARETAAQVLKGLSE